MSVRITIFMILILSVENVSAQPDSLDIPLMREVYHRNSWLTGVNPVGLSFNGFRAFSIAEAGYDFRHGDLGNSGVPTAVQGYGVYSESFKTLGDVSLYGKLGFRSEKKKDVRWQGMIGEDWHGIKLCDSVSGKQRSERYQLAGGLSLPLNPRWLVGMRLDYGVELTAKDTDPRNKNQWMEWRFVPGIGCRGEFVCLGVSLLYANRKEGVDYQNVGSHNTYPFLVAYPLAHFETLPLSRKISWNYVAREVGGALQAEFVRGSCSLFQEIRGSFNVQEITSNRIQDKKEGESHGWEVNYKGRFMQSFAGGRHEWEWQVTLERFKNYELLQEQEETEVWRTYGKIHRSTYCKNEVLLSFRRDWLRDGWNPIGSLVVLVSYYQERNDLYFHPVEFTQTIHRFVLYPSFTRSFWLPDARVDCTVGGTYRTGGGRVMGKKGLSMGETVPAVALWQSQERLYQAFRYETRPRWGVRLSVDYTHTEPFSWFVGFTGKFESSYKNSSDSNVTHFFMRMGVKF